MTATVLITGANGFVGTALAQRLHTQDGIQVRKAYRSAPSGNVDEYVVVGDIGPGTDWSQALTKVDTIIHCAARVHIMQDAGSAESLAEFRRVNVAGTRNLARQAAAAGVRRMVFVSSVKVNGESTTGLPPFSHENQPTPLDAYGISKQEAEQALWEVSGETRLEAVVVRPPLVYGPGVKANFLRLMQAVNRGIPLPFGATTNQRSMVYVQNLVDLLTCCIGHPAAAGQTFLVSDGRDLSTKGLIEQLALAMHRKPRLLPVPPSLMRTAGKILNKSDVIERLFGSLQVDISHTCKILDWNPPFTVEEGMSATVAAFKAAKSPS